MKKRGFLSELFALFMIFSLVLMHPTAKAMACEEQGGRVAFSEAVSGEVTLPSASGVRVSTRLGELFFGKREDTAKMLVPGGTVFGVKIKSRYVTVVESKGIPALSTGDVILSVGGREVHSVDDVKAALRGSGGESVTLRATHGGSEIGIEVRPYLEGGEYKLGLSLRDGAAGIGTVTYIDPDTLSFGGLGHGICEGESGEPVEMEAGVVSGVVLGGVHRGEAGKPGELCGVLTDTVRGILSKNCECGVFGTLDTSVDTTEAIPVGTREELHAGEATIYSTVKGSHRCEYRIEISEIDHDSQGPKSFKIKVTDPTLIAISGGIVRGMSGSPIIQDGKLVGAVTHVMVANPTEGYGIFIENMLNAANNQSQQKAA